MRLAAIYPIALLVALALGCEDEPEIDLCKERAYQSLGPFEICTDASQCIVPSNCVNNLCIQVCQTSEDCDLAPSGGCLGGKCEYPCAGLPESVLDEVDCRQEWFYGTLEARMCETCGPKYCEYDQ